MEKPNQLNNWMKGNAWSILIAMVGVCSTFLLYGFRIEALEEKHKDIQEQVAHLDDQQEDTNELLVGIARDIQYIKESLRD